MTATPLSGVIVAEIGRIRIVRGWIGGGVWKLVDASIEIVVVIPGEGRELD